VGAKDDCNCLKQFSAGRGPCDTWT
jgi:hypothetical protein